MLFNVNEYVRVRLTDRGRAIHASDFAILCAKTGLQMAYPRPVEDADGWSKWQFWELMRAFGEHTGAGLEPCFSTVIEIPDATV